MSEPAWFSNLEREDNEFVYALLEERSRLKARPRPVYCNDYTPCPSCSCPYFWAEENWCPECDWKKTDA